MRLPLRPLPPLRPISLLLWGLLALTACGDDPSTPTADPTPADGGAPAGADGTEPASLEGSLLVNGAFEEGRPPWFTFEHPFWGDFNVVNEGPTIGKNCGLLRLDGKGRIRNGQRRSSMVQDLDVDRIPERLAGRYFVEEWEPGQADPWIEVAVGVFEPDLLPRSTSVKLVAYPLAGFKEEGVILGNRKDVPSGPVEVTTGRWIDFEVPVFEYYLPSDDDPEGKQHWGVGSATCDRVRVYCTVRVRNYDREKEGPFSTKVRFDDLRVYP